MLVRRDVNATIVSSILTFDLNWLEVVSVFSQRSNNSKCSKWDDDFQWWVYFKGCLSTTNQSFPSGGFSRKHHALFWGRSLDEPLCSSLAASFAHFGDSQLENFHLQQPGFAEMMVFFTPCKLIHDLEFFRFLLFLNGLLSKTTHWWSLWSNPR